MPMIKADPQKLKRESRSVKTSPSRFKGVEVLVNRCSTTTPTGLVYSTYIGTNDKVFPRILDLHVSDGSIVADCTFGAGVFWKSVDTSRFSEVLVSDLDMGVDARDLPYGDGCLDALVFDPPYMEGLFRRSSSNMAGAGTHAAFRDKYSNGKPQESGTAGAPKYHQAVIDLYESSADEARRVLREGGMYIVKCQDEVSANRQELTHVQIITYLESIDFYCRDLFVVVRNGKPSVNGMKTQVHARKNHSYFLVFEKAPKGKLPKMRSKKIRREVRDASS